MAPSSRHVSIESSSNNFLIPCFIAVDFVLFSGIVVFWTFIMFGPFNEANNFFRTSSITIPCTEVGYYSHPRISPDNGGGIVPDIVVYVLAMAMPTIVILFGEAILAIYQLQGGRQSGVFEKTVRVFGFRWHPILRRSVRFIGIFAMGGFLTMILVRCGQLILGRPKPYYFSVCGQPATCDDNSVATLNTCTEDNADYTKESFPNMYAALSAYSCLFTGIYVSSLIRLKTVRSVRPLLFLSIMSMSYLLGLERLAYNEAFWSDVIGGWLIGGIVAFYLAYDVLNCFRGIEAAKIPTAMMFPDDTIFSNPMNDKSMELNGMSRPSSHYGNSYNDHIRPAPLRKRNSSPRQQPPRDYYSYRYVYDGTQGKQQHITTVVPHHLPLPPDRKPGRINHDYF